MPPTDGVCRQFGRWVGFLHFANRFLVKTEICFAELAAEWFGTHDFLEVFLIHFFVSGLLSGSGSTSVVSWSADCNSLTASEDKV